MSLNNQEKGKFSKTEIKLLKSFQNSSLIECKLHTGRTHQIRVHMSFIGNPLIGDNLYKKKQFKKIPNEINNIITK